MANPVAVLLAGAALLLGACGCGRVEDEGEAGTRAELREVVTTTGMLADVVENVAGDRLAVRALMGPGVDPHLYKASEGDVQLLGDADLVLYNGLHLEAKLGDVLAELGDRAVAAGDAVDREQLLAPPEFKGQFDPHIWFDVRLWMRVVEHVRHTLVDRDPSGRATYDRNAERYLDELRALDAEIRTAIARIPKQRRVLVTAHDAFNYFGRAYDLEVRGLQGISTATEAGAADVQELARFIVEREIPTIFVETSVSSRAIDAVREAARARGHEVRIGERLFSDAMGDPRTPEGTYVGMVRHNVRAIVEGLTTTR